MAGCWPTKLNTFLLLLILVLLGAWLLVDIRLVMHAGQWQGVRFRRKSVYASSSLSGISQLEPSSEIDETEYALDTETDRPAEDSESTQDYYETADAGVADSPASESYQMIIERLPVLRCKQADDRQNCVEYCYGLAENLKCWNYGNEASIWPNPNDMPRYMFPGPDLVIQAAPKIYIYDIPAYSNCMHAEGGEALIYGTEQILPKALRQSQIYVTKDPEEADFFYVDAHLYCIEGGVPIEDKARTVLKVIRQMFPFWDRRGGIDHIWIFTSDVGFGGFYSSDNAPIELSNSTILSHWGYVPPESERSREPNYTPPFRPGQDIVIPNNGANLPPWWPRPLTTFPKTLKMVFAGSIREDQPHYSDGVRQTVLLLHQNVSGWILHASDAVPHKPYPGNGNMVDDMRRSVFCLAPTGQGWGVRLKQAIFAGCIPVVVADHVQVEFEDLFPVNQYGLRVSQSAMFALPTILDEILADQPRIEQLQRNVHCIWPYFTWQQPGSRALEGLMCALKKRLFPELQPQMDWDTCTLNC